MGGAEKALLSRMRFGNDQFERVVLNLRPEIDFLEPEQGIKHFKINGAEISRTLQAFNFSRKNSFDLIIVRTPLDAIRFGLFKFILRKEHRDVRNIWIVFVMSIHRDVGSSSVC